MNKWLILGLAALVSACGMHGGFNGPQVISGDTERFVVYDQNELRPAAGQQTADLYCAEVNKKAELESNGGDTTACVSKQLHYCATYVCK